MVLRGLWTSSVSGADGITVHPRPDARHIRVTTTCVTRKRVLVDGAQHRGQSHSRASSTWCLRVSGAGDPRTRRPTTPSTSNAGWDTAANREFLTRA
ncbi:MAG: hypothetical protein ACLVK4_01945 [Alistipes shahii]|uniref:hypothetical protein n=1 Tax=Alistipes shahii TaxID=328814 RepID=UPI00399C6244